MNFEPSHVMATYWQERARGLGGVFSAERLHPGVLRWLGEREPGEPWGMACSGGADSVCLVLLLYAHFPERRERMAVLHFDHRLRGEDASIRDATLVKELAGGLGIPCHIGMWEAAPRDGSASEEAARAARFSFFEEVLGANGGGILFLGHQRDDIAESQLMRLSRGSGTEGLAAPRPVSVRPGGRVRLRPLLGIGGGEIREALGDLEIPWREDPSNRENRFYRNRIRENVLPVWTAAAPADVFQGAAAARELLEEDNEALEAWVDRVTAGFPGGGVFPAWKMRGEPAAVRRRALNRWLGDLGLRGSLSARAFQRLMDALSGERPFRCSAGAGVFLAYDGRDLIREPAGGDEAAWGTESVLPAGADLHLPGGRVLRARERELSADERTSILAGERGPADEGFLDAAAAGGRVFRVRPWRPGDRYHPLGAPGSRKLQDVFTDKGIAPAERRRLPVVCTSDGTIVWCPGLPPAEQTKVGESTKRVVHLTYIGGRAT